MFGPGSWDGKQCYHREDNSSEEAFLLAMGISLLTIPSGYQADYDNLSKLQAGITGKSQADLEMLALK